MTRTMLIAIAGPSGSGKSTIAKGLCAKWRRGSAELLELDRYYHDLSHMPPAERDARNFDVPEALESELLAQHLDELLSGQAVALPRYDFATHCRLPVHDKLAPPDLLVVEGLFALYWEAIRDLADLNVFVDADSDTCLERRLARDGEQRSRDEQSVLKQYRSVVEPMCRKHILPTRVHARVTVSGLAPLDESIHTILSHLPEDLEL